MELIFCGVLSIRQCARFVQASAALIGMNLHAPQNLAEANKVLTKAFFIWLHFGASLIQIVGNAFVNTSRVCDWFGVKFLGGLHEKSGDYFCLRHSARGLRARADAICGERAAN